MRNDEGLFYRVLAACELQSSRICMGNVLGISIYFRYLIELPGVLAV